MKHWYCYAFIVTAVLMVMTSSSFGEDDPIRKACQEHPRGPWCYEEKAVELLKPDLCTNITKYWGKNADGVEGYCVYEIAKKTKDCSLCSRITNAGIRNNLCNRDVCKK